MTKDEQMYLKHKLLFLGDIVLLQFDHLLNLKEMRDKISLNKNHFKTYNPRKKGYSRYGLSLTSRDGGFSGVPDLDSLYEYNRLNSTQFDEPDFRRWTPLFKGCPSLLKIMEPFHNYIGRSHILRLDKGGFFPPHRDLSDTAFRLFISLCKDATEYVFLLEKKVCFFQPGRVYFINTDLSHSLFSFVDESLFIVFNIDLCKEAVSAVYQSLSSV